jgi:hypothetical protein
MARLPVVGRARVLDVPAQCREPCTIGTAVAAETRFAPCARAPRNQQVSYDAPH